MKIAMTITAAAMVNLLIGNPFTGLFAGTVGMVIALVELRRTLRGEG